MVLDLAFATCVVLVILALGFIACKYWNYLTEYKPKGQLSKDATPMPDVSTRTTPVVATNSNAAQLLVSSPDDPLNKTQNPWTSGKPSPESMCVCLRRQIQ